MSEEETKYFSKDFEWEEVREEVEKNLSLRYHLVPFESSTPLSSPSSSLANQSEAWKSFHNRHSSGRFFKERRYLLKEFPELLSFHEYSKVLEVGCGNGSTVLPILRGKQSSAVYACDCSKEALDRAKEMIDAADGILIKDRFHPFVCDFSRNGFPKWLVCDSCRRDSLQKHRDFLSDGNKSEGMELNKLSSNKDHCCIGVLDFVTLIFTLSSLPFQKMPTALEECISVLKPGGLLLFRDYGLYDMTMLRFPLEQRVGFREYMRSDGTLSSFFCLDTVRDLFVGAGFIVLELEYCCIKSVNRQNGKQMRRVWVHGKFQKPL
ncbi:tRNA N(3)-methylcytidine methyltransferase METTL6 [Telopea speciosissima]|uniref:tRNA N(3)-methylcytidine methyltransferase METTL6 n=1 Tax=Telopea speciosissima TaxID=54955 RepID=UPI001CC7BD5A|nr:tRNA N(3)-methylcytidine methyltransferase METTL6 [Telopea speciosissima]XP_043716819.1 tRNA N(3)-methylcytidine methyltransferase METTL6 [Telopea speciosissima]